MRTVVLLLVALFVSLSLVALAPSASAVGVCSELKDDRCDGWLVCVGYRWDSRGFVCTGYGVRDPCDDHCPPPYLP
jgi:hypothetical protein